MPKAILKFNSLEGTTSVDPDKGIVFGVQIAKLCKKATFRDLDGKKVSIDITPRVIDRLLALLSAKEQITAHWTHGWLERGEDGLDSKVATFRNFRLNDDGDLIGDAFTWPGDKRGAILHAAQFDKSGMMVSTVFDYTGGEKDAVPVNVQAADFVEVGASTTALCAKLSADDSTNDKPMTVQELLTLLSDPSVRDAIKAMIKSVEAGEDDAAAAAETDAGVTDEDKAASDDSQPALMRAALRISRATIRKAKALAPDKTALLAEMKVTAEAAVAGKVGSRAFLSQIREEVNTPGDEYTALLAKYTETANGNKTLAAYRMLKDRPELMPQHEAATRARCAKLSPAA